MMKIRKSMSLNDTRLARVKTTPQMLDYDRFANRGISQYLPYVMSFNAKNFISKSINTDHLGFRFSKDKDGNDLSAGTIKSHNFKKINILVGASPALGYGATSDAKSVASQLSALDSDGTPWLNFAGHCFNAVQELLLFITHSDNLPKIGRIVIMSGFNTLVMSRLPEFVRGNLPPFYFCGEYYEKFDQIAEENGAEIGKIKLPKWPSETGAVPPIDRTIDTASNEVYLRLRIWKQLADALNSDLIFLMQPLATWVRQPCAEEKLLFNELDQLSKLGTWEKLYGDISNAAVAEQYANKLSNTCSSLNVPFGNLVEKLREQPSDDWLFVDRAHFTDHGNNIVAQSIQNNF